MFKKLLIISLLYSIPVFSQNLDKIGSDEMIKFNGGVQTNFMFNNTNNQQQFRDPFTSMITGNLNFSILDIDLPFTFSLTNQQSSFTQPFNMMAFHPTYKNLKTHIGVTSMQFSQYTFSGLNFAGLGAEYNLNKWNFKAFGGRIKKAVEYEPEENNTETVSFRRMGFGLMTGYTGEKFSTELIMMKAYDQENSLKFPHNNTELTPQDNFVVSANTTLNLIDNLTIKFEHATSLLTRNTRTAQDQQSSVPDYSFLIRGNQSSQVSTAMNGAIDYRLNFMSLGFKYERVDPGYRTLGALYFNDDLENFTFSPTFSLFKKKVNIAMNTGLQRNNLNANNANDTKRWIGNINISAQLIKGMNFNANYSNFSNFTRRNPAVDPFYNDFADTMNVYQVSQNFTSSLNYSFGEKVRQVMTLNGTYSQSQNITGNLEDAAAFGFNVEGNDTPVDVINGVFNHMIQIPKGKWSIGWMVNYNRTEAMGQVNSFFGPGINVSKPLFDKKMNISTGVTYNQQYVNSDLANHVMNLRLNFRYNPDWLNEKYGKLNMSVSGNLTNRFAVDPSVEAPGNSTVMLNIGYNF